MKKYITALIGLFIFNIIDIISTIHLVSAGICRELNPIIVYLFNTIGYQATGNLKIILGFIGVCILYKYRDVKIYRIIGYFHFYAYLLLMVVHLLQYI